MENFISRTDGGETCNIHNTTILTKTSLLNSVCSKDTAAIQSLQVFSYLIIDPFICRWDGQISRIANNSLNSEESMELVRLNMEQFQEEEQAEERSQAARTRRAKDVPVLLSHLTFKESKNFVENNSFPIILKMREREREKSHSRFCLQRSQKEANESGFLLQKGVAMKMKGLGREKAQSHPPTLRSPRRPLRNAGDRAGGRCRWGHVLTWSSKHFHFPGVYV